MTSCQVRSALLSLTKLLAAGRKNRTDAETICTTALSGVDSQIGLHGRRTETGGALRHDHIQRVLAVSLHELQEPGQSGGGS